MNLEKWAVTDAMLDFLPNKFRPAPACALVPEKTAKELTTERWFGDAIWMPGSPIARACERLAGHRCGVIFLFNRPLIKTAD